MGFASAAAVAVLVVACNGTGHHSTAARQAVHSAAANPTVAAGEQAAAKLVASCVTSAHLADAKTCIEGKLPPAKRAAAKTCLAQAAATAAGHPGHVRETFRPLAQSCAATALAS